MYILTLTHTYIHTDSLTYIHIYIVRSTYLPTYIRTYIYLYIYIPWTHKCVTKTVGCGTRHKYINMYNFYSVKYYKRFTNSIADHLYTYEIRPQNKRSVYLSISR